MSEDGGPAFPVHQQYSIDGDYVANAMGMSLRDWFAGKSMGLLAVLASGDLPAEDAAKWCYGMADAMLVERAK